MAATCLHAQECKVLLPEIADIYEGGCKKGLAHGKGKASGTDTYEGTFKKGYPHGDGTYSYANGDVYIGDMRRGEKDGEGTLTCKYGDRDTVLAGLWEKNEYLGPKPVRPEVLYKYGVDSYSFRKERDGDRFLVDILINGTPNTDVLDFAIVATSGNELSMGRSFGYENVIFPVVCKISYKSWNKLRTSRHEVIFEFKITDPGDWKVIITN